MKHIIKPITWIIKKLAWILVVPFWVIANFFVALGYIITFLWHFDFKKEHYKYFGFVSFEQVRDGLLMVLIAMGNI